MRLYLYIIFFVAGFGFLEVAELRAQEVHTYAPQSPTSSSSQIHFDDNPSSTAARSSPSSAIVDYGGLAKTQTLSIRNSQGNDFAVSLEGVRLNSPSQGNFDFGSLSSAGLGSAQLVRGGYAPSSTSPSGELQLRLPQEPHYRSSLSLGTYQSFGIAQETPHAVFSFDQSQNNYSYESQGRRQERTMNASQQLNLRTWWRSERTQVWLQFLYTDIDTPGGIDFPTPQATYQNLNPTAAFQTRDAHFLTSTWVNFQKQASDLPSYTIHSENHWITLGHRLQSPWSLASNFRIEPSLEYTFERLWHEEASSPAKDFKTPARHSGSLSFASFLNLGPNFLLHPYIRGEIVSDLKAERYSWHPGLGFKWNLSSDFLVHSNTSWISKVPSFTDMYFASPPFSLANRELKRQRSLQTDIGYEWTGWRWLKMNQTFFADRTFRIIKSYSTNGIYQSRNRGTAVGLGLENEISFVPVKKFELKANYTAQYVSLNDQIQPLKPAHSAHGAMIFFLTSDLSFDLPVYYRSSIKNNDEFASSIGPQVDLGAHLGWMISPWKIDFRVWNLLGWHRIEKTSYPLPSEPYGKITASYDF